MNNHMCLEERTCWLEKSNVNTTVRRICEGFGVINPQTLYVNSDLIFSARCVSCHESCVCLHTMYPWSMQFRLHISKSQPPEYAVMMLPQKLDTFICFLCTTKTNLTFMYSAAFTRATKYRMFHWLNWECLHHANFCPLKLQTSQLNKLSMTFSAWRVVGTDETHQRSSLCYHITLIF